MIENDLETLLNSVVWTVVGEGVTKAVYIFAEDQRSESGGVKIPLNPPHKSTLVDNNVIIVIHQSSRSIREKYYGADIFLYEGDLKVYAGGTTNLKNALDELKVIADSENFLFILAPGIRQSNHRGKYMAQCRYEWAKIESRK